MKMTPLTLLQIAVKDNVDVLYFSAEVPMNVLFAEDGNMGESCYVVSYIMCNSIVVTDCLLLHSLPSIISLSLAPSSSFLCKTFPLPVYSLSLTLSPCSASLSLFLPYHSLALPLL